MAETDRDALIERVKARIPERDGQRLVVIESVISHIEDQLALISLASPSPAQWPEDVVERASNRYWEVRIITDEPTVHARDLAAMRAALATLPPPEDAWRPIATAPRDGKRFLGATYCADLGAATGWRFAVMHWDAEFETETIWHGDVPDDAPEDEQCTVVNRGAWNAWRVGSWGYEQYYEETPSHWKPLPAPPGEVSTPPEDERVKGLVEALEALVAHVEHQTCQHDNTHRGGVLWTICDDCGAKWADDEGGKPEFKEHPAVTNARSALASYRGGA